MNEPQKNQRRRWGQLLLVSALVLGGFEVGHWAWVRSHNRLIVINEFAQPITMLKIWFDDSPNRPLTFHDVQSNREQWQASHLIRSGSGGASSCNVKIEGVTANGKRISSNGMFNAGFCFKPLVGATYFVVIIQSDGTIQIYQSHFFSASQAIM